MKFKTIIVFLTIGLLISCSGPTQAIEDLSLEDALSFGLENNSSIVQNKIEEEKVELDLEVAKKSWYPTLNLQSSYTRLGEPQGGTPESFKPFFEFNNIPTVQGTRNNYNTQLTLQQTVYGGGQIKAGIKQAQKGVDLATLQTEKQKNEILYNIIQSYYNVLLVRNRVEIEEEALELLREHKRIAEASYEQGLTLKTDILQTDIKESEAEQSLNNARNQLLLARKSLANLIGSQESIFRVSEPDLTPDLKLDLENLYREAAARRTEFKQISINKDIIELNIEKEKQSKLPRVALTGNYSWQGSEPLTNGSWTITLSGSVSLYDGGKSETAEKKYLKEMSKIEESEENLEEMIKLDLESKILTAHENLDKIKLYELNLEKARENLRLEKIRYREGVGTNVDVMNAQTTLKQTKIGKLQAEYQYKLKIFELLKATGQLEDYCKEVIY